MKSQGEIMAVLGSVRILAGIGFHLVGKLSGPGPVSFSAEDKNKQYAAFWEELGKRQTYRG